MRIELLLISNYYVISFNDCNVDKGSNGTSEVVLFELWIDKNTVATCGKYI